MAFSSQYPYLNWWIENHGFIQIGADDDSDAESFLMVLDAGGVCWEDSESVSVDEALQKAEEYLRTEEIPGRMGPKIVEEIESSRQTNKVSK